MQSRLFFSQVIHRFEEARDLNLIDQKANHTQWNEIQGVHDPLNLKVVTLKVGR